MKAETDFDPQVQANLDQWLQGDYDEADKDELRRLIKEDPQEIVDAFYCSLDFGTGGLRGIMGLGTNRVNRYTIQAATQGLANYLKKQLSHQPKVLIGYDSRHQSPELALETARVFAGNGIQALLMDALRPVPLVSFGVLHFACDAGIMITASHNPPQYNGYKVYWGNGAQVLPPHDTAIIAEAKQITTPSQVGLAPPDHRLIEGVGEELDQAYLRATYRLPCYAGQNGERGHELHIVYTALHGTGVTLVPKVLQAWGFTQVTGVEEQNRPDGDVPTVTNPNPEEPAAMQMGTEQLLASGADLLLGTDTDADRVGVVVQHGGEAVPLNGNQIAVLCLNHLLTGLAQEERLPSKPTAVKTIVTTELFSTIATSHGCQCDDVLTGFKYIGQLIDQWEHDPKGNRFVFGAEESYGCLVGTHARDKDAVVACALLCEAALDAKVNGETLITRLHKLYREHGVYREQLTSLTFPGKSGADQMQSLMHQLRQDPPARLADQNVIVIEDYLTSQKLDRPTGTTSAISLPSSNVIRLWLDDGTKLVIRPSGTEPKMKLYAGVRCPATDPLQGAITSCDQKAKSFLDCLKNYLSV